MSHVLSHDSARSRWSVVMHSAQKPSAARMFVRGHEIALVIIMRWHDCTCMAYQHACQLAMLFVHPKGYPNCKCHKQYVLTAACGQLHLSRKFEVASLRWVEAR